MISRLGSLKRIQLEGVIVFFQALSVSDQIIGDKEINKHEVPVG